MSVTKAQARRQLRQARLALSPEERQAKTTAIMDRLWRAIDWSQVKTVHCYEPIERLGEIDITDFVTALQAEHPVIQFFTSRQINKTWHIVSVKTGKPAPSDTQFNVIIVPMLGFDPISFQRIGYGGGYYDRFLAADPQAHTIGVCFELGKLDHLTVEPHDISLDIILTEDNLYRT